eukprot:171928-Karenia_brevis.AAC.1
MSQSSPEQVAKQEIPDTQPHVEGENDSQMQDNPKDVPKCPASWGAWPGKEGKEKQMAALT